MLVGTYNYQRNKTTIFFLEVQKVAVLLVGMLTMLTFKVERRGRFYIKDKRLRLFLPQIS